MTGGYLSAWWTAKDVELVTVAAETRYKNARKAHARALRGIQSEDMLPRDMEGCMGELMFNRVMEFSEEFTPYHPTEPDSNGWEVKSSKTWPNMLVPNDILVYQHRPICRVRLIMKDRLAIVGGWCFIRDVPTLSYKPAPDREGKGYPDGFLVAQTALMSIVPLQGVHGEEVFKRHWLDL